MVAVYNDQTAASVTSLARRIMDHNLCREILLVEKEIRLAMNFKFASENQYKFSRAKWYVADFDWQDYNVVNRWCIDNFGPHPTHPDAWSRWVHNFENQIHFRDEKDYQWFVLRWGA